MAMFSKWIDDGSNGPLLTISNDGTTWALHAYGREVGILHYGDDHCWHFHGQTNDAAHQLFDMLETWRKAQEGM